MLRNAAVSHQLQHICIQQVSTLPQFKVWQTNEGKLSIAILWVTWRNQKPLFPLSQKTSARLLSTRSLKQTPALHFSEWNRNVHAAHQKYTWIQSSLPWKTTPKLISPHTEPFLWSREASQEGLFWGSCFHTALLQKKVKRMGTSNKYLQSSAVQGKPSPAQKSLGSKSRKSRALYKPPTLCFQEDLSTSEFFSQALRFPALTSNSSGVHPDLLAKSRVSERILGYRLPS